MTNGGGPWADERSPRQSASTESTPDGEQRSTAATTRLSPKWPGAETLVSDHAEALVDRFSDQIRSGVEAADEVSSGVGDIAAVSEEQAAMVDEVRAATKQLTESSEE